MDAISSSCTGSDFSSAEACITVLLSIVNSSVIITVLISILYSQKKGFKMNQLRELAKNLVYPLFHENLIHERN